MVRILAGTMLPMQLILALATGVTVGAAVLVTFGVPDRRIGPGEIAAALRAAGLPVESVRPAEVGGKGSRKFTADAAAGRRLFIKALGSDQRDADLLYRAYRAVRLCSPSGWPPTGCRCCPAGSPGTCCSAWTTYSASLRDDSPQDV